MKVAAFCDVQNLFHGLTRVTGDKRARVDYSRLRKILSEGADEIKMTAYLMTPVEKIPIDKPPSPIPPEDQTGFVDDSFVVLLRRLGYSVRRNFCSMKVQETDEARYVYYVRTSMARAVYNDVKDCLDDYQRFILVSGAGALVPTAKMVKEAGKTLWVAAFAKSGDLNAEYRRIADKVIPLDETLRWVTRKDG